MNKIEFIDFPVWFEHEVYNDTWDLNMAAQRALEISDDEAENFFGREGKYMVFTVWFKITSSGEIKGPYRGKRGEML